MGATMLSGREGRSEAAAQAVIERAAARGPAVELALGVRVVQAPTRIGVGMSADFKAQILEAIQESDAVVLDCAALEWIDASGIGALIGANRWARRAGRRFVIAGLGQYVRDLFELCGIERVIQVVDTPAAAVALCAGGTHVS